MQRIGAGLLAACIGLSCAIGAPPRARADGTVVFSTAIVPLIMQRPFFARFLLDTFDFSAQASAVTIGAEANQRLAGARIGPYTLLAKRKGTPGPFTMEVVIDTDLHFYDPAGQATDDMANAASLRETFTAIEVDPLGGPR